MTLVVAWIRKNKTLYELVVASDSRLSGGESWDACPKLVPLPCPATLMAMSGDATPAYAFLLHAISTSTLLDGIQVGRTDIGYLARKLGNAFGEVRKDVSNLPVGNIVPDIPNLEVALFGWSWRRHAFEGYGFKYDKNGRFQWQKLPTLSLDKYNSSYYLVIVSKCVDGVHWEIFKLVALGSWLLV